MHRNISLNALDSKVVMAELNWFVSRLQSLSRDSHLAYLWRGMPIPTTIQRPDLILAADCVYFEPAFPLLVQTLSELSDSTTEILFSYKKRRKVGHWFFIHRLRTWEHSFDRPINAFLQYSRKGFPGKRWMNIIFNFDYAYGLFLIGIIGGYGRS